MLGFGEEMFVLLAANSASKRKQLRLENAAIEAGEVNVAREGGAESGRAVEKIAVMKRTRGECK